MTNYTCTWWENTGAMSEFNDDGVSSPIMRNLETGERRRSNELPVGALYAAARHDHSDPNSWPPVGHDGHSIVCVTLESKYKDQRSTWYIDARAANCTKKEDKVHRCWVRHGTIGDKLTVDKNGNTCAAGAGSFFMDGKQWHGFLRNGELTQG